MERISFLWTVFLSLQGSTAVPDVFVQKGNNILLNVKEEYFLKEEDTFFWNFNQKNKIVRCILGSGKTIFSNYVGRVEFSEQNYSMKLKNLQAADSGVYEAQVTGAESQKTLAKYNVTVQGPVSPVKLKVDSASRSSDSCIVNATCSTVDSDISSSFRCVNQTCVQNGGEQSKVTNSGASLSIYLSNVSIICNHSNQVSWTKDMTEIQVSCIEGPASQQPSKHIGIGIGSGLGTLVIISAVVAAVVQHKKKRQYDTEITENTVYATPQVKTTRTLDESPANDASCTSPTSTYSLVGPHTRPIEMRDKPLPESLYAQVEKPARPCRNLQEL